ncbi:LysR family transcriptional regulator [Variovorax paradoxus]
MNALSLLNRLLTRGKFRQLQIVLRVAELGSIQRTANAIGITQSGVTQALAHLEQMLEVKLFERHARGMRPTAACIDLLPVARQLMLGIARGAEIVAARQQRSTGFVRLLASSSAIHGLLVRVLPRFAKTEPSIRVQLDEAEGEDQLLAIARSEVDLAVCRQPAVSPEGWAFYPLLPDRFVVVARYVHPLARVTSVKVADLSDWEWLLLPAGVAAREHFEKIAAQFKAEPISFPVTTRALPMLFWLLQERDLLALLPLSLVAPLLASGQLCQVNAEVDLSIEPVGILAPMQLGKAAQKLFDFLQDSISTV